MAAMARGEFGVARSELERSLELEDAPATWIGLGNVAEREARWVDAIEAYEAALVGNPNSLPALTQGARLLQKTGQTGRAIAMVERARVLAPEHGGLVTWLERLRDEQRR
jgi:tetratricopeptide (TPR) repeat protein